MKIIEKIYYKYNNIVFYFFLNLNKRKKLDNECFIFQSEGDYSDNARALSDYIINNKTSKRIKIYWIVSNRKNLCKNENVVFIEFQSWNPISIIRKARVFSKAKYIFFTHPWWYKKKNKNQIVVNLWHGTTFKKPTGTIDDTYDYMICPSKDVADWLSIFTGTPNKKMIYCGYPRNDLLYKKNIRINNLVSIDNRKRIICMPTYHQSNDRTDSEKVNKYVIPYIENENDLKYLDSYLNDRNILLIIKPHHLQKIYYIKNDNYKNIIIIDDEDLLSNKIQLYELLGISDALLTDISSVYFDYLLLDKPIGFYIEEAEAYKKKRGFIVDDYKKYLPGDFVNNKEDFLSFLNDISCGKDSNSKKRREICNMSNKYKKDHCERLLKILDIEI